MASMDYVEKMEARVGIEPTNKGFADLPPTTDNNSIINAAPALILESGQIRAKSTTQMLKAPFPLRPQDDLFANAECVEKMAELMANNVLYGDSRGEPVGILSNAEDTA